MSSSFHFGSVPSRYLAWTMVLTLALGISISRRLGSLGFGMRSRARGCNSEKKAAYSQNCVRVHLAKGWSWHWAHSTLTQKNSREVAAARFSGLFSFAW